MMRFVFSVYVLQACTSWAQPRSICESLPPFAMQSDSQSLTHSVSEPASQPATEKNKRTNERTSEQTAASVVVYD